MKIVRLMFLLGSAVFAMGAVGCGDDDDNGNVDAPVTSQVDARTFDAGGGTTADARVFDAQAGGGG